MKIENWKLKIARNSGGVTLLLSILIMGAVTAVGIGMATLLVSDIRGSRNIDNAIIAFYAAESGIEDALMTVSRGRQAELTLTDTIDQLNVSTTTELGNGASWTRQDAETISTPSAPIVRVGQTAFFDLYNPDELTESDIETVILDWEVQAGEEGEHVEFSWTAWKPDTGFSESPRTELLFHGYLTDHSALPLLPITEQIYIYRVKVRPITEDLFNVSVRAFSDPDPYNNCEELSGQEEDNFCEVAVPSRISLPKSTGAFPAASGGAARQAISASVPWVPTLSSLFSYVLFSEEPIVKE